MTGRPRTQDIAERAALAAIGVCAALALWALSRNWDNPALSPGLLLVAFAFVLVYGTAALALSGPLRTPRALAGALWLAVPVAGLIGWAGQRHVLATNLLDDPVSLSVAAVLVLFALPFLQVRLQNRRAWLDYAALFDTAWTIQVRFLAALAFVGIFWLVLFLCNALLQLVDVAVIRFVFDRDWMMFALTGLVLGLGLAVVHELRDTVSPFLVLRLLRLLVPVVLVVVVIFLVAAPFRELSRLFGEFSAAGTLMGAAMAAITLVSVALERNDTEAVATRGMRAATRLLALVLPVLCALAVWAVALRIDQYGWTPDRVLAVCASLFLLAYGLAYLGSALKRRGWMRRVRAANVALALAVIGVAVLWMTPVLNAYRISSASQVARFASGDSTLDQVPFWEMAHEWGRPGLAALDRLDAMTSHPEHGEIAFRIAEARDQVTRYLFDQAVEARAVPERAAQLAGVMAVRPEGPPLDARLFAEMDTYQLTRWAQGCARKLADGRAGCVLVRGDFAPGTPAGSQGMVIYMERDDLARANHVRMQDGVIRDVRPVFDPVAGQWPELPPETVARALDGGFDIRPSGGKALWIGQAVLTPAN